MKALFKVLYSNDTTNILTCRSPFNPKPGMQPDPQTGKWVYRPSPFTAEMLEATVDETAGVGIDVHMLQPGMGWVPWWKSKVYPFEEHIRFMKEQTGMDPSADPFAAYMAAGGDMVKVFVNRCRRKALAPFVSLRLNDGHGHEFMNMPREKIPCWAWHCLSPVHVKHPEWRIGKNLDDWNQRSLNWMIPEVREFKLGFIREICEQYDIDGFELDFMRHCSFFRQNETTGSERKSTMTTFVREVRKILDQTAKPGRYRWLCVRVPAYLGAHDALGVDLPAMMKAGVNMVNLSYFYFTEQQGDYAKIKKLVPEAAVYVEMCHNTRVGPAVAEGGGDNWLFRRTTALQYYTTAHLVYARGLDGVSTFNFVYYREHGCGPRGPFNEPPFEIHKGCADLCFVARQPQHYFLSEVWDEPHVPGGRPLPKKFFPGVKAAFTLDMTPPEGGWQKGGRVRIQAAESLGNSQWQATLNGLTLQQTEDRSEPYGNPYPQFTGMPEEYRAWRVPPQILKDGMNTIEVTLIGGLDHATIVFLDAAVE